MATAIVSRLVKVGTSQLWRGLAERYEVKRKMYVRHAQSRRDEGDLARSVGGHYRGQAPTEV